MKQLCALFLLSLCSLFASGQVAGTEVPFELLPSGHLLVKAKVDGVEGNFIFDTGAGITVFTKTFFDKLRHVQPQDGSYTGFRATGERLDIDLFHVKDFEMGQLKKAEEEVSFIAADLGGIDGIISLKLVEQYPFTIDYTKKALRFETAQGLAAIKKKAKKMPVQLEQSRGKSLTLFSYFRVNDSLNLQLSLDAGAGKEVYRLNSKYMSRLGVDATDTAQVRKIVKRSEISETFSSSIYLTRLRKLSSEAQPAISTKDFPVQFVEGLIYDGIIWINWLGSHVTFDLEGSALWVQ